MAPRKIRRGPFWCYYGGKWRAAPRYPKPEHGTIIEPFAGSAGYSMRYPDRRVILLDTYPVIAEIWRYLIRTPSAEILAIPEVEHTDALPDWVPEGARYLVGFCMNDATTAPRRARAPAAAGWSATRRERVAFMVEQIRHWQIIESPWWDAPNDEPATWFVDPPYNNKAGSYYIHGPDRLDYALLARGCRTMRGQVIVCENEGADWLPFRPFATFKAGANGKGSREVIWTNDHAR